MKTGFNNELYLEKQKAQILERIEKFNYKLYLEFGGKLLDDYHASRVLPGFEIDTKIKLLMTMSENLEIIFCICANDIEKSKIRADIGVTYDMEVLRLIDQITELGLSINSIVITRYTGQPAAFLFQKSIENRGIRTYIHKPINGYPADIDLVLSDNGYGSNPYIETTKPLVVVTGPGAGSGKLATCLSQIYHEHKLGISSGYAKFETFPIWNLPLNHPINLAYEAATVDIDDVNMIDPFHLDSYNITAVNYNRDIEAFPIVKTILSKVMNGKDVYKSPTDMGVNMVGYCLFHDDILIEASKQEILRRYFKTLCDYKLGKVEKDVVEKMARIMNLVNVTIDDRILVKAARDKSIRTSSHAVAIKMRDGKIICGRTTSLMTATSSAILNALKYLADIADDIHLIAPIVLTPIIDLKRDVYGYKTPILNLQDVLTAVSICAATNPTAKYVISKINELKYCDAHSTHMIPLSEEKMYKDLGVYITCDAEFPSKDLYYL